MTSRATRRYDRACRAERQEWAENGLRPDGRGVLMRMRAEYQERAAEERFRLMYGIPRGWWERVHILEGARQALRLSRWLETPGTLP